VRKRGWSFAAKGEDAVARHSVGDARAGENDNVKSAECEIAMATVSQAAPRELRSIYNVRGNASKWR